MADKDNERGFGQIRKELIQGEKRRLIDESNTNPRVRKRNERRINHLDGQLTRKPQSSGGDVVIGLVTTGLMLAAMAGGGGRAEASPRAPQLDQKPSIAKVDAGPIQPPRSRILIRR